MNERKMINDVKKAILDLLNENDYLKARLALVEKSRSNSVYAVKHQTQEIKSLKRNEKVYKEVNNELADARKKCLDEIKQLKDKIKSNEETYRNSNTKFPDEKDLFIAQQQQKIIDLESELTRVKEFTAPLAQLLDHFGLDV